MKRLFVLIERPDETTYKQEIEWRLGETVKSAISRCKKMLGRSYWICDWYICR